VLGAIVWAGVLGLRQGLQMPPLTDRDPTTIAAAELKKLGIARLPQSLDAALDILAADAEMKDCMGPVLHDAYLRHKRFEHGLLKDLSPEEQCARYRQIY